MIEVKTIHVKNYLGEYVPHYRVLVNGLAFVDFAEYPHDLLEGL